MMTSFISKKKTGSIRHLGSVILNYFIMYSILLKASRNRGIFNRKLNLSLKGCLGSKHISKI